MRHTDGSSRTILVVEDNTDSRFMLRRLLEMSGYRIVEARSGREAVEIAGRECPDVILMDLSLPDIDGLSATKLIRELEGMCDTPVIALTGYDDRRHHRAALDAGCSEYITKPVDFDLLEEVVGGYCPA